jgi:LacI family transcriptional regulator
MITIKDVAKLAGVGVGTVSRVLNNHPNVSEDKRRRVQAAARKLRFIPNESARRMKMKKSHEVALMLPEIRHPYLSRIAFHIEDELYLQNYKLLLLNNHGRTDDEKSYLVMLKRHQIAGLVGITYNDVSAFLETGIPLVSIDRNLGPLVPCVSSDNYDGGRRACQELIKKGCKKIAFLGDVSSRDAYVYQRQIGFREEAELQGIPYQFHEMVDVTHVHEHSAFIEQFLDEATDVDGVFCISDLLALSLYRRAVKRGIKVPEQMKIIGFDGIQDVPYFHPVLSTIRQPVEDICRTAVELLIKKIEDPNFTCEPIHFPITYIEGETT